MRYANTFQNNKPCDDNHTNKSTWAQNLAATHTKHQHSVLTKTMIETTTV